MPVGVYKRQIGVFQKPIEVRFWKRVNKDGPIHPVLQTRCWLWTASTVRAGYGQMRGRDQRTTLSTHQVSWRIHNGPIPEGMCVLHHCDNPPCVNPDHLWLGTRLDNNRDRIKKGRSNRTKAYRESQQSA